MKKNIFKKIVASLATVAMAAGLFTAMPAEEAKAVEEAKKYELTVTVKGTGVGALAKDGELKLYYWNDDGHVPGAAGWPGAKMTKNDDGSFSVNVIATGSFNLIANGEGGQTCDVKDVTIAKKNIYIDVTSKDNVKVTYGDEAAPEYKGAIVEPEKKDIKVYVKLDAELDFDKVCFHRWNTGLTDPGWPGMELTDDNGIYTGTFQVEKSITKIGGQVNCGSSVFEANADITDLSTGEIYIT
ncbi:MAG: starch-binding protein, partial [Lachnospiraceae bacterium]|nr:starch-binding protein [Lachnospiraceae bacterium]